MFRTVGLRYGWLMTLFTASPASLLRIISRLRAERAAWRATRRVPAYAAFLADAGVDARGLFPLGILRRLPETDKKSYVDRYPLMDRCNRRRRPLRRHDDRRVERLHRDALQLDPRATRARARPSQHRVLREIRLRHGAPVTINAFSMGAWAAGFNMSLGMMRHGIVKSIGPDLDKILSTLDGPRPDLPLPDLGLPAVPQASPRRG